MISNQITGPALCIDVNMAQLVGSTFSMEKKLKKDPIVEHNQKYTLKPSF